MSIDEQFDQRYDSYAGEAAACAEAITSSLESITRLAHLPANLTDAELTDVTRSALLVMQQAEATVVALTADAIKRGAVYRSRRDPMGATPVHRRSRVRAARRRNGDGVRATDPD